MTELPAGTTLHWFSGVLDGSHFESGSNPVIYANYSNPYKMPPPCVCVDTIREWEAWHKAHNTEAWQAWSDEESRAEMIDDVPFWLRRNVARDAELAKWMTVP